MTEEHITRFNIRINNLAELKQIRYKGIHFENPNLQVNKEKEVTIPYDQLKEKLLALKKQQDIKEIDTQINKQKFLEIRKKMTQSVTKRETNETSRPRESSRDHINAKKKLKLKRILRQEAYNGFSLTDRYVKSFVNTKRSNQLSGDHNNSLGSLLFMSGSWLSPPGSKDFSKINKDQISKSMKNIIKPSKGHSKSSSEKKSSNLHMYKASK